MVVALNYSVKNHTERRIYEESQFNSETLVCSLVPRAHPRGEGLVTFDRSLKFH